MLRRKSNFAILNVTKQPGIISGSFLPELSFLHACDSLLKAGMMTLFVLLIICSESVYSQSTKELREIFELQDTRSLGEDNRLLKYLNSEEPGNAFWAAYALANIADTTTINETGKKLLDPVAPFLSQMLAFALGQISNSNGADYLLSSLDKNKNAEDKIKRDLICELLNSLGKTGNENDLNTILALKFDNDEVNSYIALAITRFGLRKIKNDNSFLKLAELMESSADSTLRRNIAYAFNRTADKQTLQAFNTELMTLSQSPEPYSRMWGFAALGKELDTSFIDYFIESLEKEYDWRVKVNIINALGNLKIDQNSPGLTKVTDILLSHSVNDPSTHVSIVSMQALSKLFAGADIRDPLTRKIQQEILFILTPGKAINWQIKTEAVRTYAKIFKDEAKVDLFALFNSTDNYDIKSAIVSSFGFMDDAMVYKELREAISADVQRYNEIHPNKDGSMIGSPELAKMYKAFVEALTELDDKLDNENKNIIRLILSEFASSKEPAITDLCLTNLQDSIYLSYRAETCQVMTFDYAGFKLPKDKDVMLLYLQAWADMKFDGAKDIFKANLKINDYDIAKLSADALKNITGKNFQSDITANKYRTDFDWVFIDKLGDKLFATIKTNVGDIKIKLNPEFAPFTVQNFVKLGEKGFYNNTIFHRVVPNFVIQGGDATGSGYGGPGYSIRSEFSPQGFDAYTVGMASIGKDTEGSQFFITHSPQPHLDGKYTVFGNVVEGFDVVDKIQIGDKIESITFSSN